jgi:DNA-binding NarL/FixJ family response regulator
MIRVLLVDDHTVVRAGLEELLSGVEDIEVVGSASDGAEAIAMASRERPDVVLMDLLMPDLDGIEATRQIVAEYGDARVVVLTSFSDRERILRAIDAGAVGYLLKDADPEELFRGVRAAARGDSPLAPRAAQAVLSERTTPDRTDQLTDREREVLALVGAGLPNKRIARRLEISEKTVKAHLTSIFQRIDVIDRTQAALWAKRHGLETGE